MIGNIYIIQKKEQKLKIGEKIDKKIGEFSKNLS